jgi:hypothetical protein
MRNILALIICISAPVVYAEEVSITKLPVFQGHFLVLPGDQRKDCEDIVDFEKLQNSLASLSEFKIVETQFSTAGFSIFNIRICGLSLLQWTIYVSEDWNSETSQRREVIEYLLSKVTPAQLNEFVKTSWTTDFGGMYFGTTVAVAAIRSPWCLEKILNHPYFDPTNFLTTRECDVLFCEGYRRYTSETPASCLQIADHKQRGGGFSPSYGRENAHLLVEMLEKDTRLWPNGISTNQRF